MGRLEPDQLIATATQPTYGREDEEEQREAKRARVFCCSGPVCSQSAQHNVGELQRAWAGSAALALCPPSRSPGKPDKALRDLHRDHRQPGLPSSWAKFPLHGELHPQSFSLLAGMVVLG